MPHTRAKKILNVDDDPVKRYSVTRILRNAGYEVTECGTGQEALRLAAQGFDLVVLDVNLPDITGFEVCGQLRADPSTASLMVLHVSGTSVEEEDRAHGLDAGADGYLTEPVDARVLVATVNSLLRLRYMEGLARDLLVSERAAREEAVQAAERLQAANLELKGREEETTRLLGDVREAETRKDEFLAMLGHELRNPLGAVSNALHILRQPDLSPERSRRVVATATRQIAQLTRIVDDLLDIARVSRGKFDLRRHPVRLQPIIEEALEANRAVIRDHRHELSVLLPSEPIWLHADADRLLQAFDNLLGNAIKYTPPGGLISVQAAHAASSAGEVEVRIRDTGIGIAPELLPSIFELFTQASGTLDRAGGGLGIGLSLVRTVVKLHDGTITASSGGLGQGAEFVVCLPVIEAPDLHAGSAPAALYQEGAPSCRVLVVEDNRDSAETLVEIIESWGHTVTLASDGLQALELVHRWGPDVVLLDIGLPGVDGYEVAKRLRSVPRHDAQAPVSTHAEASGAAQVPVLIALTGYGQDTDRRLSRAAGFDHHLVKPVDLAVLRGLLTITGQRLEK